MNGSEKKKKKRNSVMNALTWISIFS